jgi:tetratricopeptide (TPR) repeat protein
VADTERTGQRWFEAETHRIRGEILWKRDSANTAPAQEAFLTAIAITQQQKARSFELRGALSLAKLYQSTNRAADAHAVLAPALEGFSATPELSEIEEAQTLLAALAQSDEVKNAAVSRLRQAKLQISYANALIATRGHGALETSAAFARALELTTGIESAERFSALYGVWAGHFIRGELVPIREAADAFLRETERRPTSPEAGVAYRVYAMTLWYQGQCADARHHFERALAVLDRERDRDHATRFGQDQFVSAETILAIVLRLSGEITEAARLAEAAVRHATESGQIATLAYAHGWIGFLDAICPRSKVFRQRRNFRRSRKRRPCSPPWRNAVIAIRRLPSLAPNRRSAMSALSPLSEVKRTSRRHRLKTAFDPLRKWSVHCSSRDNADFCAGEEGEQSWTSLPPTTTIRHSRMQTGGVRLG